MANLQYVIDALIMSLLPPFTRRQQQVFDLMRQGMPTRLIAEELGVTVHAVKHHRTFILRSMGVANTAALIHALQQGQRPAPLPLEAGRCEVLVVEDDDASRSLVVSGRQGCSWPASVPGGWRVGKRCGRLSHSRARTSWCWI